MTILILLNTVSTQGLPEQIGSAVASGMVATYQESFRAAVVPAFERSCAEMMKQVDENFRRATADCTCCNNITVHVCCHKCL